MLGRRDAALLATACGFCLLIVAGCSRGPERVVVSGAVTYRGQPVARGAITFAPCEGTVAPTTMAAIVDGKYSVEPLRALPVGTYKVSITAVRNRPGSISRPPLGDNRVPPDPANEEQYLPAKYNAKTELKITLETGQNPAIHDFALTD
ncbi:MAG: hypothetical protein JXM70_14570 [Pirellulales bacterium]|nr:hypothetical protein [Pirellulales bacterium]